MLGYGANGQVIKYNNYAIKNYKKIKDMIREILILNLFKNDKEIVDIISFSLYKKQVFLELYNSSLFDWCLTAKYNINIIKKIIKNLLFSVHKLHSYGLVHSDIKLENILIKS